MNKGDTYTLKHSSTNAYGSTRPVIKFLKFSDLEADKYSAVIYYDVCGDRRDYLYTSTQLFHRIYEHEKK